MLDHDAVLWINGEIVSAGAATVSAMDHGLVVGDAAFETLLIVDGVPFAIDRHIRRMHTTLAALAISPPSGDDLRRAMLEVTEANGVRSGRLRVTVTAGLGPLGSGEPHGPPTIVAAATPLGDPPAPSAVTVPWVRNERGALAGLKTTSYAENVRALRYAHEHGAGEALFANTREMLCEGTGTNVFVAVGGELFTPPLDSGCLAGVTRELLLEVVDATETELPLSVLTEADEVFLTSSTRNVQGMAAVDGRVLDSAGPLTVAAIAAFAELQASSSDP